MVKIEIPVNALQAIIGWLVAEDQQSATQRLKTLLESTLKYQDYFFSQPWTEDTDAYFDLPEDSVDMAFIQTGGPEDIKTERVHVAMLRRHIAGNGFNPFAYAMDRLHYETELVKRPRRRPVIERLHALLENNMAAVDILHKLREAGTAGNIHEALNGRT